MTSPEPATPPSWLGRFRKKPVEIEAVRWTGVNHDDLALWGCLLWETNALEWSYTHGAYLLPDGRPLHLPEAGMHPNCLILATLEGFMLANPDDIIIRGVQGEFYACKPDIFAATYEPADRGPDNHPVDRLVMFRDATGEWRWRAVARNQRVVAASGESYHNHADCESIARRLFPAIPVDEETTEP